MKQFLNLISLPLLSACSLGVYGDDFDCDPSKGMGCKSISEVNEEVTQRTSPSRCTQYRVFFPAKIDANGHLHEAHTVTLRGELG